MTSLFSTITSNVNLLLVDSYTIVNSNEPYIAYVSSVSVPGKIATVRDSTGNLGTNFFKIRVSTTKGVSFTDGTNYFDITQPFGFVTMSSRDKNTWNILNAYAFPDPYGISYVSTVNVRDQLNTPNVFASSFVSTLYLNTSTLEGNIVQVNNLSSLSLNTSTIFTNNLNLLGTSNFYFPLDSNIILYNSTFYAGDQGGEFHQALFINNVPSLITDYNNKSALINQEYISFNQSNNDYNILLYTNALNKRLQYQPYIYSLDGNLFSRDIAQDWSYYGAEQNVNLNNSSIQNVNSLSTINIRSINISTTTLATNSISSLNIRATNISTTTLATNSISSLNIRATNLQATSISTIQLNPSTINTYNLKISDALTSTEIQNKNAILYIGRTLDMSSNNIQNINNLFASTITISSINNENVSTFGSVNWSYYKAINTVDICGQELQNIKQTNKRNDGATNFALATSYVESNVISIDFGSDTTTPIYRQVLNNPLGFTFSNITPTPFSKYLMSIQFVGYNFCNLDFGTIWVYAGLSNNGNATQYFGRTFNSNTPYQISSNSFPAKRTTFSYQDIIDFSSWSNGNKIVPELYVVNDTATVGNYFENYLFTYTLQPVFDSLA